MPDIQEHLLPGENYIEGISQGAARAILRYVEELKMHASIEDGNRACGTGDCMTDSDWLDAQYQRVLQEWPLSDTRKVWLADLKELEQTLQDRISQMSDGAFVKLSVRSPKDSAQYVPSYKQCIRDGVAASEIRVGDVEELSDTVKIIKEAAWLAMRVESGADALQLLLRSDRIYVDILQADLFAKPSCKTGEKAISLVCHVHAFFKGFHPDWEFRGFVSDNVRTGLTVYNPWVYDKKLIENKLQVLSLINNLWDEVQDKVRSSNYSIDFAVSPALDGGVWIVEINNFLPPLAGSGLFVYQDEADRAKLKKGPFEFRIKESPVKEADFINTSIDKYGRKRTLTMKPAPDHIMRCTR
jgi:hypothetical protein